MVPPTAFEVETLNFATFPSPDREAVMAFACQTGELQRDSLATRHYSEELKGDSHQIWRTQRVQVNLASLRLFLRSSTGPNRAFETQSLGRVRDPVRIAEGPTRDFGFSI